jgi:hypothetical protein
VSSGALLMVSAPGAAAASESAKQIVLAAISATKTATSVRVVGSVTSGTQTIGLSVRASDADQGLGTITINGATVKLVRTGKNVYFNADAAFWTQNDGAAAAVYAGQWVSATASSANGKSFAEFLGASALTKLIFSGSTVSDSTFKKASNATVAGVKVSAIVGTNTADGTKGTVYIARSGKPYIVELTKTNKTSTSKLVFSAYNQPVHAKVPKHAITIEQLEQRAAAQAAAS